MITVIHVMADGTVRKDITGVVVKRENAPTLYALVKKSRVKSIEIYFTED